MTGALHLGHALNNTIQDILIRSKRMQGFNALWMPGTDHAGIATQAVVERRCCRKRKALAHDLGREKLVARIWDWKNDYERRILGQLKRLGCSCDWQRTRFTLDDSVRRAVRHTFFSFFKDGLDLSRPAAGELGHVPANGRQRRRSFSRGRGRAFLAFEISGDRPAAGRADARDDRHHAARNDAGRHGRGRASRSGAARSTQPRPSCEQKLAEAGEKQRPEIEAQLDALAERRRTMLPRLMQLRDMARAGRRLMLPLLNREIPLVADEWAKPEMGSGCVKITPAHDPNDYEVGKRQSLPMINILNPTAR